MTNQVFNDPLKELEIALAVEPSPEFAVRVRTRVAESGRPVAWLAWQRSAAAAVVAVAVLGALSWRASVAGDRTLPERAAAANPGVAVASGGAPAVAVTSARPTRNAAPTAVPSAHATVASAPEALVPPDQAIALNRLLAALRERRTAAAFAAETPIVVIEELPQISPVRLEPIKVDPLVPNSPSSGGKEKDR
jgi:hypothetical protein